MLFTLNRNKVIGGTSGHFVRFEKGKPTFVPKSLWADVQAAGAVPSEEIPEEEVKVDKEVFDPVARKKAFFDAFKMLMDRNDRGDFTASGLPNSKVLEKIVGFQVVNKERDEMWSSYQLGLAEADE